MGVNVFDLFAKIGLDATEFQKGMDSARGDMSSFGSVMSSGFATVAKVGAAAFTATAGAATAFAKSSVDAGRNFDSAMSQVAATMGTTVDQIGELRDFAKEMGASTAFSATEAAQALNYMALAGYDAEKSMSMLPNVLNLAASGGMELATASDMVTDAQSALGLSMEETTELVNKMAKTASSSNTSVAQLGEAMLQIGGTAKKLAGGTTELTTVLGILADNGMKGAEGGTHLRNMLNSLMSPTKEATAMMDKLGVSLYDDMGNMRELNDVFLALKNGMAGLATQEERDQVISTIFNARDMKAAEALLAGVGDRYEELSNKINDAADAASDMAGTQLDNLTGDITLFKSALEGVQISISDKLTPTLREFTQFGGNALQKLSTALEKDGFDGALEALGEVIDDGFDMLDKVLPRVLEAGAVLTGKLVAGIAKKAPDIVKAGINIAKILGRTLAEQAPEILKSLLTGIAGEAKGSEIFNFIVDTFNEFAPAFERVGEIVGEDVGKILNSMSELGKRLDLSRVFNSLDNAFENFLPLLDDAGDRLAWFFDEVLSPVIEWSVNDFAPVAIDTLGEAFRALKVAGEMFEPVAVAVWQEFLQPLAEWTGDAVVIALGVLKDGLKAFADEFEGIDWTGYWEDIDNFGENWTVGMNAIKQGLTDNEKEIEKFFDTSKFGKGWRDHWEKVGSAIYDVGQIAETAGGYVYDFKEGWVDLYEKVGETIFDFKNKWVSVFTAIGEKVADFKGALDDATGCIADMVSNSFSWGHDLVTGFADGVRAGISYLTSALGEVTTQIYEYIHFSEPDKGPLSNFMTYAPDMMETFAKGITDNADKPRDAINNMLNSIRGSFTDVTPSFSSYSDIQGAAGVDNTNSTVILQLVDNAYNTIARGTVNAINFLQGQTMNTELRGRQL